MNPQIRIQRATTASQRSASRPFQGLALPLLLALLAVSVLACLGAGPDPLDPALSDPDLRAARIEELKLAIAQDHATLEDMISRPDVEDAVSLHDDPQIRTIAARLTDNERALNRLEEAAADGVGVGIGVSKE